MPLHIQQDENGNICGVWTNEPTFGERCLQYSEAKGVDASPFLDRKQPLPTVIVQQEVSAPRFTSGAPVKFYVIPQATVREWTKAKPLPEQHIQEYQVSRPHILEDGFTDIWQPNCRSAESTWKDFSLFENVNVFEAKQNPEVVIVFPTFLEIFESAQLRDNVPVCIQRTLESFPENRCVFQWNHDVDAATVDCLRTLPERAYVVNFNTSKPTPNDILVPFWTIDTKLRSATKNYKSGFIGYVGGIQARRNLRNAVTGMDGYYFMESRCPTEKYLDLMSQFKFALCPRGGGLNSYRFYEAIHCGAVPVLFADAAALPYPDLNYGEFCLRVPESEARDFQALNNRLSIAPWPAMWKRLLEVRERFSLLGVQREIYGRLK